MRLSSRPGFAFTSPPDVAYAGTNGNALFDRLYERMIGTGLSNQPTLDQVRTDLDTMVSALMPVCIPSGPAPCDAARTQTMAQGACAAVLASAEESGPFEHQSHKRPVTRREFLGQGFITGAAMIMGPSLVGLFGRANEALAQSCGIGGLGTKVPFLVFDLGGGASTAGSNVIAGGPLGQLDPLDPDGYIKHHGFCV